MAMKLVIELKEKHAEAYEGEADLHRSFLSPEDAIQYRKKVKRRVNAQTWRDAALTGNETEEKPKSR